MIYLFILREGEMKEFSQIVAVLALGGAAVFSASNSASAQKQNEGGDQQGQNQQGSSTRASLRDAGTGLPILVVGYSAYRLTKRRRKGEQPRD
jgi:hypothetical protein